MATLAAPRWTKASTLPTTSAPMPSSTTGRRSSPIDFANYFCTYDFANLLKKFQNREVPTWPIRGYNRRDEKSKSAIWVLLKWPVDLWVFVEVGDLGFVEVGDRRDEKSKSPIY
ncbi:hypothetical protein FF2_009483 [Malus domestica]